MHTLYNIQGIKIESSYENKTELGHPTNATLLGHGGD